MEVENTLKGLQEIVGGYIETVTIATDLTIICDEEGRLKGKPHNCNMLGIDLAGTIMAVGVDGPDFNDCPISLDEWQKYFAN